MINFIIFVTLTFAYKKIFQFITNVFCANFAIAIFSVFSFEQECANAFLYSIFGLCLSYCLTAFTFMVLKEKFKTDNIEEFKKINDKTKICQLFTTISLLNLACVPLFTIFSVELICLMMIFATDYEHELLNMIPYCLILGIFLISLVSFNVLYKILIEPVQKITTQVAFSNHQIIICIILILIIITYGICPELIFKQMGTLAEIREIVR